jgi:hypothetical protein
MTTKLGKLQKIELREGWSHEALGFTRWLAQEENLEILAEELGIENIRVIQTEANAGDFSIDILAEEEQSGDKVIIENQLEKTDHKHLGQILTYASSQNAKYIIWVSKEVRDEHKQAIDWLNEHTDEDINFFCVQIELWKIGDSDPAPKFNVISKPNDWTKIVKKSFAEPGVTDTKLMQLEFWTQFKEYAEKKGSSLKFRTPKPQHWYDASIGSSEAHIVFSVNSREKLIGCEIWINNNKDLFDELYKRKADIEKDLGASLNWQKLEAKKASRIKLSVLLDFTIKEGWERDFEWMNNWGQKFKSVFGKYIKEVSR